MQPKLDINHAVAFLGIVLGLSLYMMMQHFGVPSKICFGSAILSILVVSVFWSTVNLGIEDEEE
jgi:hypothetical protein